MNAGQRELQWMKAALPQKIEQSCEENWRSYLENGIAADRKLFSDWNSFVPGSLSPCHLVVAAIQCMRNKGYDVTEAEKYIEDGLKAEAEKDGASIQRITAKIYHLLNTAPKDTSSPYWSYRAYRTWEELEQVCSFPDAEKVDVFEDAFTERIRAGWLGQLIGGALGTQVEGYLTENIRRVFGEVRAYLRTPETYNDDITYEIAFLDAFREQGYDITSEHIADKWLELISDGYSAEEVALRNLRCGIRPPESGRFLNYYSDWIGAQMRTAIHGMAAPGNARLAARLAAQDSVISHSNNGLIGGIFNAVLVSLAFVEQDMKVEPVVNAAHTSELERDSVRNGETVVRVVIGDGNLYGLVLPSDFGTLDVWELVRDSGVSLVVILVSVEDAILSPFGYLVEILCARKGIFQ